MVQCPSCRCKFSTPSLFSARGWSTLRCPNCRTRLKRKARRFISLTGLAITLPFLFWTATGHRSLTLLGVFLGLLGAWLLAFWWNLAHPILKKKKPFRKLTRLKLT